MHHSSLARSTASRPSAYGGGAATSRGPTTRPQAPQPPLRTVLVPAGPVRQSSGAAAVAPRSNENAMASGRSTVVGGRSCPSTQPQVGGRVLQDVTNTMRVRVPVEVHTDYDSKVQEFRSLTPSPLRGGCEDAEAASEYLPECIQQLFDQEARYMLDVRYMEHQLDITAEMRAVLVDWLVDVHIEFRLKQITLFLSMHLLDQYLSRKAVLRTKLQLVGVVALLVAAKFEEDAPTLEHLVYITDRAYSVREIRGMECHFLSALGYEVMAPTAHHFL